MTDSTPLIIAVAPNGARKTCRDHPALPVSPAELAETAQQCMLAGAAMIHLHVRGEHMEHSLDADRYRAAISAIRARIGPQMIIQVTTEAVGVYDARAQMAMVRELKPEAVSLAVRELCPEGVAVEEPSRFFAWLLRERISPQYILYSPLDVERFLALRERGVIPGARPSVLFVLGRYGENNSSPEQILPMLDALPADVIWSVCAFGSSEADCLARAAELGGHCRVGFENNLHLSTGEIAPDNAALVAQLTERLQQSGRRVATPQEARTLLGMLVD